MAEEENHDSAVVLQNIVDTARLMLFCVRVRADTRSSHTNFCFHLWTSLQFRVGAS